MGIAFLFLPDVKKSKECTRLIDMSNEEMAKIFCDRLFEICLLKDIPVNQLISVFNKSFEQSYLESCFCGETLPNDTLLVALSQYLNTTVDAFFEQGERITDKNNFIMAKRNRQIKHLETVLGKKIIYTAENYTKVLKDNIKKALDTEKMSISKAASILEVDIKYIRENF